MILGGAPARRCAEPLCPTSCPHHGEENRLRASLTRGLEQSAAGLVSDLGSFAQYADAEEPLSDAQSVTLGDESTEDVEGAQIGSTGVLETCLTGGPMCCIAGACALRGAE